jgi:ankyrin repeat protein
MEAAKEGHLEIVKLLIQRKANLKNKTITGWTAFKLAEKNKHIKFLKYLKTK